MAARGGMNLTLVVRQPSNEGQSRVSFTRASAVVNCQSTFVCVAFLAATQAAT